MKVKEIIVVEGKDDVSAVKRAVEAEVITTEGFRLSRATLEQIKRAQRGPGVIIFTDPDTVGEKIRKRIDEKVAGCKHAFLPKEDATSDGDIGIENATPIAIQEALRKVRTLKTDREDEFTQKDLIRGGLIGSPRASELRAKIGQTLGIGYTNAKQFLTRLNNYGVSREEFEEALKNMPPGQKET
jgi:ribonuclease M5